jgi:hypothetical protein
MDDTSFLVSSSTNIENGSFIKELCETLILTIVMILWKGIVGSDDEVWMVCVYSFKLSLFYNCIQIRGQIFSALRHLHREYEFYFPLVYLERRILELSMETCLNELQINKTTPTYERNCQELIKIIDDFLSQSTEINDRLTENFVHGNKFCNYTNQN